MSENEQRSIDPCQHEWAKVEDDERLCLKCGMGVVAIPNDRYEQPQRWLCEGLESLSDGIKWAGFWIGLGVALAHVPGWMEKLP
jgi:hypothetical protein